MLTSKLEENECVWKNGKTLLCHPDPREFDRLLDSILRKHGYDEFHIPIKKEKTKQKIVFTPI